MKKLYVGKVDPKFEISREQIEKYNLKEGTVLRYSGCAGQLVVSEDTILDEVDIKEISKKGHNDAVDIKEIEGDVDIKEIEDEVDIKEI